MKKVSIEEITTSIQYGFTESAMAIPVGPKFLRITDIQEGQVNWDTVPYCVCNDFEKFKLAKGDIVFARTGATTGKSYLINGCPDAVFASYLIRLRVKEKIYPNYVYYFFQSEKYWSLIRSGITGSTQGGLNATKLSELEIPLPDYKTQIEIAEQLEQADKARQQRKAANALTDQFLQSSFLSLFGDPVKNEKGWEVKSFSKLAHIEKEAVQSENIGNKNNYVGLEHIEKDTGRLLAYQYTSEIDLKSTKFSFTKEHILYGKLRPYLNKVCLPNIDGVCSTDILPIKAISGVSDKYFIAYLMKQPFFIEKATSMSNGANLPRISPKTLETFDVIIPPLSLQQQFSGIVAQAEQLRQKQRESERELENLFQGLLQRYFG